MKYLKPEMFTEKGINEQLKDIIKEKETAEFQFEQLRKRVDEIKSVMYKELLIYERKKEYNKNLMPDVTVLSQMKELERTPEYKEIKVTMDSLKIKIKKLTNRIEKEKSKLKNLFKFHNVDVINYAKKFRKYIKSKDQNDFIELMESIFEKEFQNRKLYMIVNLQRNYPIFNLLIEKAPDEFKSFFRFVIREQMRINDNYDYNYLKENNLDIKDLIIHLEIKLDKFLEMNNV